MYEKIMMHSDSDVIILKNLRLCVTLSSLPGKAFPGVRLFKHHGPEAEAHLRRGATVVLSLLGCGTSTSFRN